MSRQYSQLNFLHLQKQASHSLGYLSWLTPPYHCFDILPHSRCYTTLRDPIEMFASYFYQRHPIAALEGRNLSSLSPQALRRALDTIPRVELDDNYYLRWWAELGGPANSGEPRTLSALNLRWVCAVWEAVSNNQPRAVVSPYAALNKNIARLTYHWPET